MFIRSFSSLKRSSSASLRWCQTHQALKTGPDDNGMRLDRWLRNKLQLPQALLEKHLRRKEVTVSSVPSLPAKEWSKVTSNTRLHSGQYVLISTVLAEKKETPSVKKEIAPELVSILRSWVIYKDKHILVLNKPSSKDSIASLLGALKYDYKEEPSTVHRLDRDTSGALLIARTKTVARILSEAWRKHEVKKLYWAIVVGKLEQKGGIIRAPLEKARKDQAEKELVRLADSKSRESVEAVTTWNRIDWIVIFPIAYTANRPQTSTASVQFLETVNTVKAPQNLFAYVRLNTFVAYDDRNYERKNNLKEVHIKAPPPQHMQSALETLGFNTGAQEATL